MHILGGYLAGLQARADGSHSAALRELEYERRSVSCDRQHAAAPLNIDATFKPLAVTPILHRGLCHHAGGAPAVGSRSAKG